VPFDVRPAGVDEQTTGEPAGLVQANAQLKALAVPGAFVLGADTVVEVDGEVLGKPPDAACARAFLARLSGREHRVLGGVAIARDGAIVGSGTATTRVEFRALDPPLLDWYVATGEWRGRSGGYAIQGRGAALVRTVSGDYLNVVGLPVALLLELVPELLADST
jgi:septum formation protein